MTEPRDPRELFSFLCARVQHFAMAPGGIPGITQEDVAHAMGKIKNEGAVRFAGIKYAGQYQDSEEFVLSLRRKILSRSEIANWRVPRANFILDLCWMALVEVVGPHTCPYCQGTQNVVIGGKMEHCHTCKGDGHILINAQKRAGFMLCTESAWSHSWSGRYDDIRRIVVNYDEMSRGALGKRLLQSASTGTG